MEIKIEINTNNIKFVEDAIEDAIGNYNKQALEAENTEFDYGHNVNYKNNDE